MVHYSTPSTASANFASCLARDSSTRNHPDGGDDPILGYELHRLRRALFAGKRGFKPLHRYKCPGRRPSEHFKPLQAMTM